MILSNRKPYFYSLLFYPSCGVTLGKSNLKYTVKTCSIQFTTHFLTQPDYTAPFLQFLAKALMEGRQNKVLLPSAGLEHSPAHQHNGLAHPNNEVHSTVPLTCG